MYHNFKSTLSICSVMFHWSEAKTYNGEPDHVKTISMKTRRSSDIDIMLAHCLQG